MFFNIINSECRSGEPTRVTNPRTNEPLLEAFLANEKDLNDTVEAARIAFKSWKLLSVDKRQNYLLKLADALEQGRDEIHGPLAAETGKSVREHLMNVRQVAKPSSRTSLQTLRSMTR